MRPLTPLSRLGAILASAWPLGAAATLIVPVSQTRTLSAYVIDNRGAPSSSASYAVPDFANVNRTVVADYGDATFNPDGSQFCCRWTSRLRQDSRIEADRLYAGADGALSTPSRSETRPGRRPCSRWGMALLAWRRRA